MFRHQPPSLPRAFVRLAAVAIITVIVGSPARAREDWPAPTAEAKRQTEEFQNHEDAVLRQIQPQLPLWATRGKPFIPWAAKPDDLPQAKVPAFPGAAGGGEFSFGGRGGRVYVVTSLADGGPGTLREACEAAGPRIVVFNVAGIIHLMMPIFIEAPYLTIAGQTAPGDGICIADQGLVDNTHDVVIRYLRLRRGNTDIFNRHGNLYGNPVGNIIVDHCSASWGDDQNIDTYRHMYEPPAGGPAQKLPAVNVTIQWCISSEALNTWNHAFGGDWGGRHTGFHHNLFACNTGRNPSIAMTYDFNFVNNVLFNWRHRSVDGGDQDSRINMINNYYKPGPATLDGSVRYRIAEPAASWSKKDPVSRWGKVYAAGNYVVGYPNVTADNWDGGIQFQESNRLISDPTRLREIINAVRVDQPFPMPPMPVQSATDAYDAVLAGAGATLPRRDLVDERVVESVRTGVVWEAGRKIRMQPMPGLAKNNVGTAGDGIITDVSQVGGYPDYRGQPRTDLGPDGIPFWWKKKYGLDPTDADLAGKDLMGDGYTVMDKYLDGLDPTKKIDWSDPASNVNSLSAASFSPGREGVSP